MLVKSTSVLLSSRRSWQDAGSWEVFKYSSPFIWTRGTLCRMMRKDSAQTQLVYSRVTLYYNCRIELKWKRSLHHCEKCDLRSDFRGWGTKCGAIHFGRCTPVTYPFPQNYSRRKGSHQNAWIPVAKVSPTRPAGFTHHNSSHVLKSFTTRLCRLCL